MPGFSLPTVGSNSDMKALANAFMMLVKELKFLLQNLDNDNISELDASKIKNLDLDTLFSDLIVANTIITNSLYANYIESKTVVTDVLYAQEGRIARLTVDHLLTGDFLSGDEYIYFIEAKDQYLKFIIGTRRDDLPMVQYTDWDENLLYWDSADHNYMTPNETEWPVMVYVYDLMTKLQMDFEPDDSGTMVPKIILGAGAGVAGFPDYGKAYIYKETDGLLLRYIKTDGTVLNLYLDEDGIHQTGSTGEQGIRNIHIDDNEPGNPQTNDLWIKPNDYSRYDTEFIDTTGGLSASGAEVIFASGSITLTLFTASGNNGVIRIIKNVGAGTVTIDGYSAETIDSAATKDLAANEYCTIISDGVNWQVIG